MKIGKSVLTRVFVVAALLGTCLTTLLAQGYSTERPLGMTAQQLPEYLKHAGIEQHLNRPLPMEAQYTDESGTTAPLNHWMTERPAIVALVYYRCKMMCPQVLYGLASGLRASTLVAGKDYDVLIFSIDPEDKPDDGAYEKANFLQVLGRAAAGDSTHFLTGSPATVAAIPGATGFDFVRVPGPDGKMDQFAHSSVIMFVTPDGRLSKYISGIDYPARDLRLAVLDASQKRISNPVDLFMIYCCNYNPTVGRYSVAVLRVMSVAGAVTVCIVAGMIWLLSRRPKHLHAV